MELESCVGSIIARGRAHSVPTPRFDLVYAALRPHQLIAVAKAKGG
jgi:ketopantoate reductase